jgi:hypothetical protein
MPFLQPGVFALQKLHMDIITPPSMAGRENEIL